MSSLNGIFKEQFLSILSEKILDENLSLFIGAGISQEAGYPAWAKLLEPCMRLLKIEHLDNIDLFKLAQYYANEFGSPALSEIIEKNLNRLEYKSDVIDTLIGTNFKQIWTTNFDRVIEKNLEKQNIKSYSIHSNYGLTHINDNIVNVFKLNGDIKDLSNIIITQNDIEEYEKTRELMITFLKKALISDTFLFLGYSFSDSLVLNCIKKIHDCLGRKMGNHYTILRDEPKNPYFKYFVKDLESRYHIKTLLVDEYDDINPILKELNQKVTQKKVFISGSFDTLPEEENQFADQLCKELAFNILSSGYRIITGMGRKIENYLAGHAMQYMLSNNIFNIERYLIMRPFQEMMPATDKYLHRSMLIEKAHSIIFIFGKSVGKNTSLGVKEEFEIAKAKNKIIIPVGSTGYQSALIWEEVKNNIVQYPYLERYMDDLYSCKDPIKISNIIISILQALDL
ncbi:MAG: SIR2 family protein [Lachnospiraceae bacterium]|nr:SIR2 family protein [Lachnospiraceae bacterium]